MKTTVVHLEGIESVLSSAGVEKKMCKHPGIHKVETNFMTGTATVHHDDGTDLVSPDGTCYFSAVSNYSPAGSVNLSLRLNYANAGERIDLGALGILIEQ